MENGYAVDPVDFMHGKLLELFHEFRKTEAPSKVRVEMSGLTFNKIVTEAKNLTIEEYSK